MLTVEDVKDFGEMVRTQQEDIQGFSEEVREIIRILLPVAINIISEFKPIATAMITSQVEFTTMKMDLLLKAGFSREESMSIIVKDHGMFKSLATTAMQNVKYK